MKVDLPTPGTPLRPRRKDFPVWGSKAVSSSSASTRWSGRVDSSRVMALATPRRSLRTTLSAICGTLICMNSLVQKLGGKKPGKRLAAQESRAAGAARFQHQAFAFLICSSTSLALAGIGVPGP